MNLSTGRRAKYEIHAIMKHANRMTGTFIEARAAATSENPGARWSSRLPTRAVVSAVIFALAIGCGKGEEAREPEPSVEPQPTAERLDDSSNSEEQPVAGDEPSEGDDGQAEPDANAVAERQTAANDDTPRVWDEGEIRAIRSRMGIAPPPSLDLNSALRRADVREYFGYRGALPRAPLAGTAVGPQHNAIRYATEDGYGFGLEAWTFPTVSQGQAFYNEMSSSLFVSEPFRRPGVDATISLFAGIRQLLAFREAPPMVISITCQSDSCDPGQMARLLSRVLRRL